MSELDLEVLRKTHGRVVHVRYNGHDLVFRRPNQGEAQMYRASLGDDAESRYEAMSSMAQFICVHPGAADLNALIDEYPFMLSNEGINDAISKAMGVREEKKEPTPSAQPKRATQNASPSASPTGLPSAREAS